VIAVAELDQAAQQLVRASARISPHEVEGQAGQSSATSGTPWRVMRARF
jgi:hypothetical protein